MRIRRPGYGEPAETSAPIASVPVARTAARIASAHVAGAPAHDQPEERALVELVGGPFAERLAARWDDLCETWSQMTFYLFDPESWR